MLVCDKLNAVSAPKLWSTYITHRPFRWTLFSSQPTCCINIMSSTNYRFLIAFALISLVISAMGLEQMDLKNQGGVSVRPQHRAVYSTHFQANKRALIEPFT